MPDIKRRAFIALLGAVATWPLAARGQQSERMRRIGGLLSRAGNDREGRAWSAAFREEIGKLGWVDGRNVRIEYRWATPDLELMRRYAKELVTLQPALILTQGTSATTSMLQQSRTIPII